MLQLPKDVIWIILKQHIQYMYDTMCKDVRFICASIHEKEFIASRFWKMYEITFDASNPDHQRLSPYFFIDFMYPLRLVCRQFNSILQAKVVRKQGHVVVLV
jgi:hypothetical protein